MVVVPGVAFFDFFKIHVICQLTCWSTHICWWFQTCFIVPYLGNSNPNWRTHIFRGVGMPPTRWFDKGESVASFLSSNWLTFPDIWFGCVCMEVPAGNSGPQPVKIGAFGTWVGRCFGLEILYFEMAVRFRDWWNYCNLSRWTGGGFTNNTLLCFEHTKRDYWLRWGTYFGDIW